MENYDSKSCNNLEKLYYRPIEAALRWCNLINHESQILETVGTEKLPPAGAFPQWPCLRLNVEKIWAAIQDRELPYGRDGKTVEAGDKVREDRITIKHTDLRTWMLKTYPDQKPKYLFDEIERGTHSAINADTFRALQADRDALRARIANAEDWAKTMISEKKELQAQNSFLNAQIKNLDPLETRERHTLLTIIAALVTRGLKLPINEPGKTARYIEGLTDELGAHVSKRAIEDHLKKIPNGLESRMK